MLIKIQEITKVRNLSFEKKKFLFQVITVKNKTQQLYNEKPAQVSR